MLEYEVMNESIANKAGFVSSAPMILDNIKALVFHFDLLWLVYDVQSSLV